MRCDKISGAFVGFAMGNTSVKRADIFVTTKIPCAGSAEQALAYVNTNQQQLCGCETDSCDHGRAAWCHGQPFADL